MLDAITGVTESLRGEKYATLCLVLPGVVQLLNTVDTETDRVRTLKTKVPQGRMATEADKQRSKACCGGSRRS